MNDRRACDCRRPLPDMVRLAAPGLDRYYLCPTCGTIRVELASRPGLVDEVRFVAADDAQLPAAVHDQARVILRKNRNRLGVDPGARGFQERLRAEYGASLDRLVPLKDRLAATDCLIDLIVYRLYGLTPEEVAVVEGAL